jgi:hypothetical protein
MRECRTYGSERGATGNGRPYRDPTSGHLPTTFCIEHAAKRPLTAARASMLIAIRFQDNDGVANSLLTMIV